jgi:hypothetical protein
LSKTRCHRHAGTRGDFRSGQWHGPETPQQRQIVSQVNDPNSADVTRSLAVATVAGLNAADVTVQADISVGATGMSYGGVVARYSGVGIRGAVGVTYDNFSAA